MDADEYAALGGRLDLRQVCGWYERMESIEIDEDFLCFTDLYAPASRLVEEDARRAGFVTHLRPYGPLPCDRVEIAAYTHSLKSRRHIPLWHQDGVDDDFGSTRVKAALARACRDCGPDWDDWHVYQRHRRWFG